MLSVDKVGLFILGFHSPSRSAIQVVLESMSRAPRVVFQWVTAGILAEVWPCIRAPTRRTFVYLCEDVAASKC